VKTAFLALGSNLGDRKANLRAAVERLASTRTGNIAIERVSAIYETAPVGVTAQPDFYNLVVEIRTDLPPRELLRECLAVESSLGRVRTERWGPRTIDVDVLWYEGASLEETDLTLPHPRMLERSFVLTPLAEIAPNLLLGGKTVAVRAGELGSEGIRKGEALFA
jgi:2-amino-4-hydroxy-6-hydroxymethyldihydropteridine diphosphokinase